MQHLLQKNAFAVVIFVTESGTDALQDELRSAVEGNGKTVSLHQRTCYDTGEGIARAGIVRGKIRTSDLPIAVAATVVGIDGGHVRIVCHGNTGDDDNLRAFVRQLTQIEFQLIIGDFGLIRFIEQVEQFGEIGRDDVRTMDELLHLVDHRSVYIGVQASVVAQHGVDHHQAVRRAEIADESVHNLYLTGRAEITGIEGIKLYFELFPLTDNLHHLIREVKEREAGILGMAGQHGGG